MALWTPALIDTALWLDAADEATLILISNLLAEWRDKSGHERHPDNVTAARRPAVSADGFNSGHRAVNFAGTEKFLELDGGFITDAFSVFLAHSGGAQNERVIDQRGTGSLGAVKGWQIKNYHTSSDVVTADDGGGNYRGNREEGGTSAARITSTVFPEGGEINFYRNGTLYVDRANGGSVPTDVNNTGLKIRIGGNAAGGTTQDFTGLLAEVILCDYPVNAEERQKIEGYLAHKWGLAASLPAEHPYKSAAPAYGFFHGIITDKDGNPAERRITVLDATGQCVATDTSDPVTGAYSIAVPAESPYTLVFDGEPDRNAQVFANVIPGEPPA